MMGDVAERDFDPLSFLSEPLRMAQVASVAPSGVPILGSMWFVFRDRRFWFSSPGGSPLPMAAAAGTEVAVLIDDFSPPDRIRQIRVRGAGRIEAHDRVTVERIYERYLGKVRRTWPQFFVERAGDPRWVLWSVSPDSGVAVHFPNFRSGDERRWRRPADAPF